MKPRGEGATRSNRERRAGGRYIGLPCRTQARDANLPDLGTRRGWGGEGSEARTATGWVEGGGESACMGTRGPTYVHRRATQRLDGETRAS